MAISTDKVTNGGLYMIYTFEGNGTIEPWTCQNWIGINMGIGGGGGGGGGGGFILCKVIIH